MAITNSYNNPVVHNWNLNDLGEPTSLLRENESKPVVGGKILLEEIPDAYRRVFIDGYLEIDLKQKIIDEFHYKVDYTNGIVFFHSSKEGRTINITRYYGRGMFYTPSSRIWTKIDDFGNVVATLSDMEDDLVTIMEFLDNYEGGGGTGSGDMLKSVYDTNLDGKVDNANNSDTVNGFTLEKHVPISAKLTDTITTINGKTGTILKEDIEALGIVGTQGEQGIQGIQGVKGDKGDTGNQGIQGVKGDTGNQGIQGEQGLKGDKGDKGDIGNQGIQGETGATGKGLTIIGTLDNETLLPLVGVEGDAYLISGNLFVWLDSAWVDVGNIQGVQGIQGMQGIQGIQGIKGDTGEQGIQGLQGIDGYSPIKGVDYFDGAKGDKGDKGDIGLTGLQGIQGLQGNPGEQGIQGDRGLQGETGLQGIQGIKGETGEQGIQGVAGLKGDTGDIGVKGDKGDVGEQGIQGVKGDTGNQGIQGIQGIAGTDGLTTSVNGVTQVGGAITLTPANVGALPIVGGTLTGIVEANNNSSNAIDQIRNIRYYADGDTIPILPSGVLALIYVP